MLILAFESSARAASVALVEDGRLISQYSQCSGLTHSRTLLPMAEDMLKNAELTLRDVDLIAVAHGPGSFTGIRIGVSTVKALAHAAGKPCIGIDALEALAANAPYFDGVICPILDARAQQVYGAMFEGGMPPRRLMDDEAEKLSLFLDRVEATGRDALFMGDGVAAMRDAIAERLGDKAHFAPAQHVGLRAASACALAQAYAEDESNLKDCMTLLPLYLRAPQAERERAAKLAAQQKEEAHG